MLKSRSFPPIFIAMGRPFLAHLNREYGKTYLVTHPIAAWCSYLPLSSAEIPIQNVESLKPLDSERRELRGIGSHRQEPRAPRCTLPHVVLALVLAYPNPLKGALLGPGSTDNSCG